MKTQKARVFEPSSCSHIDDSADEVVKEKVEKKKTKKRKKNKSDKDSASAGPVEKKKKSRRGGGGGGARRNNKKKMIDGLDPLPPMPKEMRSEININGVPRTPLLKSFKLSEKRKMCLGIVGMEFKPTP